MDVLIQRADGGLTHLDVRDGEDIGAVIDKWETRNEDRPAVGWRLINRDEFPSKRFRNAWRLANGIDGPITVALGEARRLRVVELEERRTVALARLRERIEDAEDRGQAAKVATLKAKRRAVRLLDLDAVVQAAATVEALDAIAPADFAD